MDLFYDILDGIKHYTGQQEQFLILLSFLGPSRGYKKKLNRSLRLMNGLANFGYWSAQFSRLAVISHAVATLSSMASRSDASSLCLQLA